MIKIWYQSFGDLNTVPIYRASLEAHTARVADPGTIVQVHGLRAGTYGSGGIPPLAFTRYPYFKYLNQLQMVDKALLAEKEGFDAFVCGCFHDPALREIRSVANIPVLSLAENAMLLACSFGHSFGVVTLCREFADYTLLLAQDYGLESRLAGVQVMQPAIDELTLENPGREEQALREGFGNTCRALRDAGAEVLLPGDGNLNEALEALKIREAAGLPVMDVVGAIVKMAECYVGLHRKTGLGISRGGFYANPPVSQLEEVRSFYGLGGTVDG